MALPVKTGVAALAVGGTATAGYFVTSSNLFSSEDKSYRSKFLSVSLLNTSSGDNDYWTKRLEALNKDTHVSADLATLKNKTIEDLRKWCNNSLSKPFEEGKLFKEIDTYCTFKILDKLSTKAIPEETSDSDGKWQTAFTALSGITENLGEELERVKKTTGSGNETKVAVKGWCKSAYSSTYKGDSDKLFDVARRVCVSSN